jgi:4-amino-4-deoxy-L-arabinose transferase-like glycosyltransferase
MRRKLVICLLLFVASLAVRVLVWQNNKIEMATVQSVVTENYLRDARALAAGDIRTFLAGPDPPSNARVIDHPPGYPLLIGVVYAIAGDGDAWHVLQLALNSLAAILLFLIAATLFGEKIGIIAGVLTAQSPQFAYHSCLMLPDELSVIPILAAIYFLIRARLNARLVDAVLCGICLGLSCWLRSNALFLPLFVGVSAMLMIAKGDRMRFAAIIIATCVITIAPITIRNAIYFNSFIPLSLGGGTTFVEGLGDIDDGGRALPRTDEEIMQLDANLDGSGMQYSALYAPRGLERDRRRMDFGLSIVEAEPFWFARGVATRGMSTFRLERVPAMASQRDERETTNAALYWLNRPLKVLQRAFVTAVFLPLVLIGLVVTAARRQWRELIVVLIVPLYFATVQPLVHTEYRYVLATPHMLMIAVAVALCWLFGTIVALVRSDRESAGSA